MNDIRKIAERMLIADSEITQDILEEALNAIQKEIKLQLPIFNSLTHGINIKSLKDQKMHVIKKITFNSEQCGIMSPIINNGELEFSIGINEDEQIVVSRLEYSYKHPSGSNGYSLRPIYHIAHGKVTL